MRHQLHDFNPGIDPNGVFWIVQVPDDAVQITGNTLTIHLQNVPVVDQFQFPTGTGHVPVTVSFDVTYTKSGMPRRVRPTTRDPLSPFAWAGTMWMATNSGTFSVAYNNGKFAASGSFSSSGNFGEMGTENNGFFVAGNAANSPAESLLPQAGGLEPVPGSIENPAAGSNAALLKGRVPIAGFSQPSTESH